MQPLDVPLIVDSTVLGSSWAVTISMGAGKLIAPSTAGVGQPIVAPKGFDRVDRNWGHWTTYATREGRGQVAVEAVAFEISLADARLDFDAAELDQGYARGLGAFEAELRSWIQRFQEWAQVVVRQALSLLDPSPTTLSAPSAQPITWLEVSGKLSWPDSSQSALTIVTETTTTPLSERVANRQAIERIVTLTNDATSPHSAVVLTAAARRAAQRGRLRLALMDLGTGLEALLSELLQLPQGHKATLGPLTSSARRAGINLPNDVMRRFIEPRNAAVHGAVEPSRACVIDALGMLDLLVQQHLPGQASDPSLERAHRPQRHDLHIIKPPT